MNFNQLKVIFFSYWMVVFLLLIPSSVSTWFRGNFLVSLFLPPHYRMYVQPPDTDVYAVYDIFKEGKLVHSLNSNDYFRTKIADEKPFGQQYLSQYIMTFKQYHQFDYAYERWYYDNWKDFLATKQVSFDSVIQASKSLKAYANNIAYFGVAYAKQNYPQADSVLVHINRSPIVIADSSSTESFTKWLGHKTMVKQTIKLQ